VLSSIFPEEIQFDGKNSPTPKLDEALLLILSIEIGSGTKEKRRNSKIGVCPFRWSRSVCSQTHFKTI
jgi:hypothetical protein